MRSARHRHDWDPEPLADALGLVAAGLRSGLPPGSALRIAAESSEWGRAERLRVESVVGALERGSVAGRAWQHPDDGEEAASAYRTVGAVWDLASETGAPLADAVLGLSDHLREEARVRGQLGALAAGPRTSQRMLTLLPVIGPLLALLIGAEPVDLYLRSPAGAAAVMLGAALTVLGWRWSRSMVRNATRPRRYSEAARLPT